MKSVFSNDMCIHAWANRSVPHGRNSNRTMSFQGNILRSYSTDVANRVSLNLALITSRTFSVTTTAMVGSAARACRYNTVAVHNVTPVSDADHAANLTDIAARLIDTFGKMKRARTYADLHARTIAGLRADYVTYVAHFDLDVPPLDDDVSLIAAGVADYSAKVDAATLAARIERNRQYEIAEQARRAEYQARLAEWIDGGDVRLGHMQAHLDTIALRLAPNDPKTLQTSWGAEVPVAHAIRVFKMARTWREKQGNAWLDLRDVPNSRPHVGLFHLDAIEEDGTIHAGCHTIAWAESERMARILGEFP